MKPTEVKAKFIILRAEGWSYSRIAAELNINKQTCSNWERELSEQVAQRRAERLEELYEAYGVGREHLIKKLGEVIERIDAALAEKDFSEMSTGQLLKLRLDYEDKLQAVDNRDDWY